MKEKKLREKAEQHVRQIEKDLAALKIGGTASGGSADGTADVTRLKGEVERLEMSMQEALVAQQVRERETNLFFCLQTPIPKCFTSGKV